MEIINIHMACVIFNSSPSPPPSPQYFSCSRNLDILCAEFFRNMNSIVPSNFVYVFISIQYSKPKFRKHTIWECLFTLVSWFEFFYYFFQRIVFQVETFLVFYPEHRTNNVRFNILDSFNKKRSEFSSGKRITYNLTKFTDRSSVA